MNSPTYSRFTEYFRRQSYGVCLGISAVVGGLIGWYFMPEPRAIDGALVLAGIVEYPPESIQGVYFHNMWTSIHQLLAMGLAVGVDQSVVSSSFNAVLGAVSFSGLALVTLALTENAVLALTSPPLIILCNLWLVAPDYPILFFASHSYGQLALALSVLSIAMTGNGRLVSGGVVAGILPSVHLVLGAWTIAVILSVGCLFPQFVTAPRARFVKGLVVGGCVSVISFVWFWEHRVPGFSLTDPALIRTWMDFWEYHRQLPYRPRTVFISAMFLACGWMLLDAAKRAGRDKVVGMTVLLLVSAAGSQILYELVHHFKAYLPDLLINAMPSRLINLHFVLAYPVLLALLLVNSSTALTLAVTLPLMALDRKLFHAGYLFHTLLVAGVRAREANASLPLPAFFRRAAESTPAGNRIIGAIAAIGIIAGGIAFAAKRSTPAPVCSSHVLEDCQVPAVFRQLSTMPVNGLVAAPAGLALAMHRHGHKPVLAGASGLDYVAYLPGTVTQMRDILENIYGINFNNPPEEYRGKGYLLPGQGKDYWSSMSVDDWRRISMQFCVGAVVAPSDWEIKLLPTVDAENIRFYVMPWPLPAVCGPKKHVTG